MLWSSPLRYKSCCIGLRRTQLSDESRKLLFCQYRLYDNLVVRFRHSDLLFYCFVTRFIHGLPMPYVTSLNVLYRYGSSYCSLPYSTYFSMIDVSNCYCYCFSRASILFSFSALVRLPYFLEETWLALASRAVEKCGLLQVEPGEKQYFFRDQEIISPFAMEVAVSFAHDQRTKMVLASRNLGRKLCCPRNLAVLAL